MALNQKEYQHQYYLENREKKLKKDADYYKTPIGRATRLLESYNTQDRIHCRGKGDLTREWIIENIFTKQCAHCEKTGWDVIGCNRIDDTKPHTKDNVEPCCEDCNHKQYGIVSSKAVYQYTLDGELIAIWSSATEAAKETKLNRSSISECCRGHRYKNGKLINVKTYKGYKWSYVPL